MDQTKPLPVLQGRTLVEVFCSVFPELEGSGYFLFVDIDEIFLYLIGGKIDGDVFDLLEESCKNDINSYVNLIDFCSFLEVVIQKSEELEFYEICHNAKILLDESVIILQRIDEFYKSALIDEDCNSNGNMEKA